MRTYIEIDGNEICLQDVLDKVDIADVLDHYDYSQDLDKVLDEYDVEEVLEHYDYEPNINDIKPDDIVSYLTDEWHRGAFSDFPFDKLFTALGVKHESKNG